MAERRRIAITEDGNVTLVRFVDRKIIDAANIQEMGEELFSLLEQDNRKQLLLSFANVEFLSSAALNKLIVLDRKLKAAGGKLALSNLRPEIQEVFAITRLNQLFEIQPNESEALKKF
jgi:anti-sigma B factor antagonist